MKSQDDKFVNSDLKGSSTVVEDLILNIRGIPVILDKDIAFLYGVETRRINEQVKRNADRFPEDFMFQLSDDEFRDWKSQNATSNSVIMGARKRPYAFTESGVAMLSSVLKSSKAVEVNIKIMRAFVTMRHYWMQNSNVFQRLEAIEYNQLLLHKHQNDTDRKIEEVLNRLDNKDTMPFEGFFYEGQIFDAYSLMSDLIRKAKSRVILIDNYVDDRVLKILDKRYENVRATIYTDPRHSHIAYDLKRHNEQYPEIETYNCSNVHDRFLIIDDTIYFIGGSIKDLGKKIVAFTRMHQNPDDILSKLRYEKPTKKSEN
ncbi:MAG: ORF6N domain-containing protein [Muribaculaceae bacterium]|nr:ORF6N domain-containing protein [Muribaculaceae bacterium]